MSSEHFHEELDGIHPGFGDSGRGCALMLERSVVTPAESWARVTKEQGLISRGTRARLCLCWDAGHGHGGRDVRSRDIPGFPSSWLEVSLSPIKEQQVPWRAVVPRDAALRSGHTDVVTAAAHTCHSPLCPTATPEGTPGHW